MCQFLVAFVVGSRRIGWPRLLRFGEAWVLASAAWAALTLREGLPPVWVASVLVGIYYASVLVAYLLGARNDGAEAEPTGQPEAVSSVAWVRRRELSRRMLLGLQEHCPPSSCHGCCE